MQMLPDRRLHCPKSSLSECTIRAEALSYRLNILSESRPSSRVSRNRYDLISSCCVLSLMSGSWRTMVIVNVAAELPRTILTNSKPDFRQNQPISTETGNWPHWTRNFDGLWTTSRRPQIYIIANALNQTLNNIDVIAGKPKLHDCHHHCSSFWACCGPKRLSSSSSPFFSTSVPISICLWSAKFLASCGSLASFSTELLQRVGPWLRMPPGHFPLIAFASPISLDNNNEDLDSLRFP